MFVLPDYTFRYFSLETLEASDALPKETLQYIDLTCLIYGELLYYYDDTFIHMKAGDAILFPKYATRKRLAKNTPVKYVSFNLYVPDDYQPLVTGHMKKCLTPQFSTILDMFLNEWTSETPFAKQQQLLLFSYLYNHLAEVVLNKPKTHITAIKQYIYKNLSSPLRIGDIAAEVHLAPEYCCMIFKKNTGKTIVQYINEQRMELAKQLLTRGDSSIQEVALRLGYKDASYFTKTFRRYTGMTPSEFSNGKYEMITLFD